ncbi:unnamed protein product [Blepharisma stoltei]|uniref:Uncharacterized protein n=1 Tax=Blepharisma stoltei TaxID=1481888 RepID=A0AAU9IN81_9CILI|nr:unnamed protein product [Blepharisma stoltei]
MKKVVPFNLNLESRIYPQFKSQSNQIKSYRRTSSTIIGNTNKSLHKVSQSTNIPTPLIEEDPREEIEIIKEELQERFEQQKKREEMMKDLYPSDNDSVLVTEEIYIECPEQKSEVIIEQIKEDDTRSIFICCRQIIKCLFM